MLPTRVGRGAGRGAADPRGELTVDPKHHAGAALFSKRVHNTLAAIGLVNFVVMFITAVVGLSIFSVASRVNPNAVAAHAFETAAVHSARKQASSYVLGLLSSWILGPSAPTIPWQLELDANFWHLLR